MIIKKHKHYDSIHDDITVLAVLLVEEITIRVVRNDDPISIYCQVKNEPV